MQKAEQRLVTQVEFAQLAKMEPIDLFMLVEDGKLPIVKKDGAHLIDLNNARAKCWLPGNRGKDLF
jgi:hypothetical protein